MFYPQQQTNVNPAINNLTVHDAIELFTTTQIALADIEANGIKIDVNKLAENIKLAQAIAEEAGHKCLADPVGRKWQELFPNPNLQNRNELAEVLFTPRGFNFSCPTRTATGKPQCDKKALERMPQIKDFTYHYLYYHTLLKTIKAFMQGLYKVLDPNNIIHPSFSLLGIISYRTSCTAPNIQQIPNHDDRINKLIRSVFVPHTPTSHFVEVDYSGSEVRCNASINRDPSLVASVTEGLDFHTWVASESYLMPQEEVTKQLRQSVKGKFTFAAFYGSYWKSIAESVWDNIAYDTTLVTKHGIPLKEWIASRGIIGLGDSATCAPGTYFAHIHSVEQRFWSELFPVYAQWKRAIWQQYLRDGHVDEPSGFRCAGLFTRNVPTNLPAQGSSAHLTCGAMTGMHFEMKERGMRSKIIGEIHDSILASVEYDELDTYCQLAHKWMVVTAQKRNPWLRVPLAIEVDVAPIGMSWADKKAYDISHLIEQVSS